MLVISGADNVATALEPLDAGRTVDLGGITVTIAEAIPRGHKVALRAIRAGERVIKYGSPIGSASADIAAGTHVHTHNVASARGRGDLSHGDPRVEGRMRPGSAFLGYPRADGRVGVRNHVLVVPTVICAAVVAERIAAAIAPIGAALPHLAGCGQLGPDLNVTHDTLAAYTRHPNVGAVIVVALGCEQVVAQYLADSARQAGKPAQIVSIQGEGGTVRATARGIEIARELAEVVGRAERAWCPASALVLSVKCGGSDYTSGLASNPVVGRVADRLVDLGGAVVLGEIAEIMGAEHLLAARASTPAAADRLLRVVSRVEAEAMALGLDIRGTQPSPGNIRGGLTTIEEKSLGATHKAGERTRLERRRRLLRADHQARPDRHGHAGARRRVGHRHGRRRRADRRVHDRAGHAHRQSDRAGRSRSPATPAPRRRWPTTPTWT